MKIAVDTSLAPAAIGPYSQGVDTGNLVFLSGQLPVDPKTVNIVDGGIKEQTAQVFENIKVVLNEAGLSFKDIVKTTVFLKDINDFSAMNEVYAEYINNCVLPARSAFQVAALPKNALVEIETIAVR